MKIFRFFGMALVAACMSVNFTACSSDDGSDGEGGCINEKKLTKIVSGEEAYTAFSYDNQGRVVEVVDVYGSAGWTATDVYQYTWCDDAILVNKQSEIDVPRNKSYTYNIDNGRVYNTDKDEDIESFYYNNSNRLSQIKSTWRTYNYFWSGDKLMAIDDGVKFTYKESCSKGFSPIFVESISSEPLLIVHPEIIGCRTKQLPATKTETWDDGDGYGEKTEVLTYSYTFDNEGYISKIEVVNNREKLTYTLTWE